MIEMAEVKKKLNRETSENKTESSDSKVEPKREKAKATPKNKQQKPFKPYVHIDTFLQTAIPYFGLSNVQAAGFKAHMNGRHYLQDEQIFVEELKKYLNLK